MNLNRFPRREYLSGPTPIEKLSRLSEVLGGPDIYIKRDDISGMALGGNKLRKLEFLVADALSQGADTLITCGAIQSNHCRLTLAAAVKEGLKCQLVLKENVPGSYNPQASGNNLLFNLLGAEKVKVIPADKKADMGLEMQELARTLAAEGRKAYIIPLGGSNALGAMGYAACALEILCQSWSSRVNFDYIVSPSASSGTHAGLLAGFWGMSSDVPVIGINVLQKNDMQKDLVYDLAQKVATEAGAHATLPRESVVCFDEYLGEGYSLPTAGMVEAVRMLASMEGILLDPVYTGKTMAGLIDLTRKGFFKQGQNVLFLHTGGSPALFSATALF